jgi:hypothetical protein
MVDNNEIAEGRDTPRFAVGRFMFYTLDLFDNGFLRKLLVISQSLQFLAGPKPKVFRLRTAKRVFLAEFVQKLRFEQLYSKYFDTIFMLFLITLYFYFLDFLFP